MKERKPTQHISHNRNLFYMNFAVIHVCVCFKSQDWTHDLFTESVDDVQINSKLLPESGVKTNVP